MIASSTLYLHNDFQNILRVSEMQSRLKKLLKKALELYFEHQQSMNNEDEDEYDQIDEIE